MKIYFLICITLAAVLNNVNAQADPTPSQVDMHALYCVEAIKSGVTYLAANESSNTDSQKQVVAQIIDKANSNLQHLQRYLLTRTDYITPMQLVMASQQAKDDMARSMKEAEVCYKNCDQFDLECAKKCTSKSDTPDCNELSFLPF